MAPAPDRARAARWGDLRLRVVSALVLAPLALTAIWVGGLAFTLLIAAAAVGVGIEWIHLCGAASWVRSRVAGLAWIALAGGCLIWLRADPTAGRANVLFLVLTVWASDVGAYMAGRLIGGPRLAPRLSPGKTWAGAAGGLAAAAAIGTLVALACTGANPAALGRAAALGAAASVLGQAGDLAESCAKRCFGVKDSGRLIPGHGGLLDRLDAVLAVIPAAALLAYLLGHGVVLWG